MARVPAPVFVVPMTGVTVLDSDDVVIPSDGLETTVDDHIANEIIEGSLRVAGQYGNRVLDLSTHQPPSTIAATPAWMLDGPGGFSFTFTQTSGSTTNVQALLSFDGFNSSICIYPLGIVFFTGAAAVIHYRAATFSLGQPVTITVRPREGLLTISGATTGNGTVASVIGAWTWPAGVLGVGRLSGTGEVPFAGTLSNVTEVA